MSGTAVLIPGLGSFQNFSVVIVGTAGLSCTSAQAAVVIRTVETCQDSSSRNASRTVTEST